MRSLRNILTLLLLAVCLTSQSRATCSASDINVQNPKINQVLTSPFLLKVVTNTADCTFAYIDVFVDGHRQFRQFGQSFITAKLRAGSGPHTAVIRGVLGGALGVEKPFTFQITSNLPAACRPDSNQQVRVCQPTNLAEFKTNVITVNAAARTPDPIRVLLAFSDGEIKAESFGRNAGEMHARFQLPRGLHNLRFVAETESGAPENQANVLLLSPALDCQTPFISVLAPIMSDVPGFPPFLAAADAAGCPITGLQVYVDNQLQYVQFNQKVLEGRIAIPPGLHRVVVQAFNSHGGFAKKTILPTVTAETEPTCLPKTDPGVIICEAEPVGNQYVAVFAGTPAAPTADIGQLRLYADNVLRSEFIHPSAARGIAWLKLSKGRHRIVAVAFPKGTPAVTDTVFVDVP